MTQQVIGLKGKKELRILLMNGNQTVCWHFFKLTPYFMLKHLNILKHILPEFHMKAFQFNLNWLKQSDSFFSPKWLAFAMDIKGISFKKKIEQVWGFVSWDTRWLLIKRLWKLNMTFSQLSNMNSKWQVTLRALEKQVTVKRRRYMLVYKKKLPL